jgi:carbonic anhydrase/acetyltransferase-like protein (isoleucine patch superfamily)
MAIFRFGDDEPVVPSSVWIAETATVIGRVHLGEAASVWYGAVLRGDNDRIVLGARTNVQENSILHTDAGIELVIGDDVTIGHQAMLHGCTIGDGSLIGIQAIVLNKAVIGRHCIVGAGSVVSEGKSFPDGSLIVGSPARVVRTLEPAQIEGLRRSAAHYVELARRHRTNCSRIDRR